MSPGGVGLLAGVTLRAVLAPTPHDQLLDAEGRPYFLWDCDVTLDQLRRFLGSADRAERAYWTAKVMRQAKPDDALVLIPPAAMKEQWALIERYLGTTRPMWAWLLDRLAP
ncbi:MAG: hypothetical protein A2138_09550 [Deltaproteobacteria bacterium RBG_16_71_12]|nr:MAG: hypothetical protein A2138_09550 [Deltaproteobacteria bacterium RBG_16_71_12]